VQQGRKDSQKEEIAMATLFRPDGSVETLQDGSFTRKFLTGISVEQFDAEALAVALGIPVNDLTYCTAADGSSLMVYGLDQVNEPVNVEASALNEVWPLHGNVVQLSRDEAYSFMQ
jgi:hypothetical protein